MLFNSYEFIFVFLPVTLFVFYRIGGMGHHQVAIAWLVGASLFFYAWWNPAYVGLILFSVLFNYAVGVALASGSTNHAQAHRKWVLTFGVGTNLSLLGYFKYANFFVDSTRLLFDSGFRIETIILPLAISFFTFQQVAYLVDAYRRETRELNFLHYSLFVTFFPQLIAGPIVHHREMLPQFAREAVYRLSHQNLVVGVSIFSIGLFKKAILADGVATYATPVFDAAARGEALTFFEAWGGAMAYTFQIYFDFAGYSDMAIGAARMFGIRLPLNFYSPYKASNIIQFWRRWHMTLSRFLRDYLYIPLGGNRKGKARRHINLFVTMLLGGLWHGAGWTFIFWGALHGLYLIINHSWHGLLRMIGMEKGQPTWWGRATAHTITFLAVIVAWVFFRAETMPAAVSIIQAMAGFNGFTVPADYLPRLNSLFGLGDLLTSMGLTFDQTPYFRGIKEIGSLLGLYLLAVFMPNTAQFMARHTPALDVYEWTRRSASRKWWQWRPTVPWAVGLALLAAVSMMGLTSVSEFLYFQF